MSASHGNSAPQGLLRSVSHFLQRCPAVLVTCTTDRIPEAPGEGDITKALPIAPLDGASTARLPQCVSR